MLEDLYTYCESPIETPDVKNKASAYEYLIKRKGISNQVLIYLMITILIYFQLSWALMDIF